MPSGALDMPLGWLFDGPADEADTIVRTKSRRTMDLGHNGMVKELLTPDAVPGIQMMRIVIQPGGSSGEERYNNDSGAKCGLIVQGTLAPGDSFTFDATSLIRLWCASDQPCEVAWIVTPAIY